MGDRAWSSLVSRGRDGNNGVGDRAWVTVSGGGGVRVDRVDVRPIRVGVRPIRGDVRPSWVDVRHASCEVATKMPLYAIHTHLVRPA